MVGSIKSIKFKLPRASKGGARAPRFRAPPQGELEGCTKPRCTCPPLRVPRKLEFYTFYTTYHAFYTFFIFFLYFFYTLGRSRGRPGDILALASSSPSSSSRSKSRPWYRSSSSTSSSSSSWFPGGPKMCPWRPPSPSKV